MNWQPDWIGVVSAEDWWFGPPLVAGVLDASPRRPVSDSPEPAVWRFGSAGGLADARGRPWSGPSAGTNDIAMCWPPATSSSSTWRLPETSSSGRPSLHRRYMNGHLWRQRLTRAIRRAACCCRTLKNGTRRWRCPRSAESPQLSCTPLNISARSPQADCRRISHQPHREPCGPDPGKSAALRSSRQRTRRRTKLPTRQTACDASQRLATTSAGERRARLCLTPSGDRIALLCKPRRQRPRHIHC